MKRPIKFRGRDSRDNVFYGTYNEPSATIDDWEYDYGLLAVNPDSVAQLIGYDKDGKEVYEGDVIADDSGKEFIATLVPMMIDSDGKYYHITDNAILR